MARWCGGRRGQKVGPLPTCHSIVVRNSPYHPPPGLVMNSQREAGQKPKAVLRGDPHLSATDRCESGFKPVLRCCQTVLACARACVEVRKLALAVVVTVARERACVLYNPVGNLRQVRPYSSLAIRL